MIIEFSSLKDLREALVNEYNDYQIECLTRSGKIVEKDGKFMTSLPVKVGDSWSWPHLIGNRTSGDNLSQQLKNEIYESARLVWDGNILIKIDDNLWICGLSDHGTDHTNRNFIVGSKRDLVWLIQQNVRWSGGYKVEGIVKAMAWDGTLDTNLS